MTYPPSQPNQPDPYPSAFADPGPTHPPARPQRRRTGTTIAIAAVAILLVAAGGAAVAYGLRTSGTWKDSGIAACEAIRAEGEAKKAQPSPTPSKASSTWTPDEYQRIRDRFGDSWHEDLRTSGTKFADLVWQVSQAGDNAGAAFALIGQVLGAYSELSGACANHGVVIPPLSSGDQSASASAAKAGPKPCAEVLRPGVVLTDATLDEGCTDTSGGIRVGGAHTCKDGRRLYANDGVYGFVGESLRAGDAGDPGFGAAYRKCTG